MDQEDIDAPANSKRRAGMRRDIRAAAIGGLAATFVVAAAFAPKLLSHPAEVKVHNSSTESGIVESTTTTGQETTTSDAPVTTATTADLTTRVDHVEQRVTRLESSTTTTTAAPVVNPTVPAVPPLVVPQFHPQPQTSASDLFVTWDDQPSVGYAVSVYGSKPYATTCCGWSLKLGQTLLLTVTRGSDSVHGSFTAPANTTTTTTPLPNPEVSFDHQVMEGNPTTEEVFFKVTNPRANMTIKYLWDSNGTVSEQTLVVSGLSKGPYTTTVMDRQPFLPNGTMAFKGLVEVDWDGGARTY